MSGESLPKTYIFGAGAMGKGMLPYVQKDFHVLAFLDNDTEKQGGTFQDVPILAPSEIAGASFDVVFVASQAGAKSATEQLLNLGVQKEQIRTDYVAFSIRSRVVFLNNLGEIFLERGTSGCAAECGVFMGEFASEINRVFPESKLYLFDTFTGFDERDLEMERSLVPKNGGVQYSDFKAGHFNVTKEDVVLGNMPHPDKCVIRKGYFPETAEGIDETFCFVNLDFDLYKPTLAGLEYFYPRMVKGGVILIHDYFSTSCKGVRRAVKEFEDRIGNLHVFPIGDGLSVFFQC